MTRFLLLLGFLTSVFFVQGQEIQTIWVNDNFMPVSEKRASYKKVLTMHDSVLTIHIFSLKDRTQFIEHYCNGRPVGIWKEMIHKKVIEERDFNNISYTSDEGINSSKRILTDSVREVPPSFVGGDQSRFMYLMQNIYYPYIAREHGLQGTTYLSFIVTKEGNIDSVAVLQSSNPYLDYEAVRVVKSMPKWIPGTRDGEPVDVLFNMPIKFTRIE